MKQLTKTIFAVVCLSGALLLSFQLRAQNCGGIKPTWATSSYHRDLQNSYLEVVVMSGSDAQEITRRAQAEIERRRRMTVGLDDVCIKSGHIAEYWECSSSQKTGYFLYQTRKKLTTMPESVVATDKYPFSARVFVPGLEQFHKGQKGRAAAFISTEVVFVGGIVATQCLKANYTAKIGATNNSRYKQAYARNANICKMAGYGAITGAVAVYVWNIIDGACSRGKPYVSVDGKQLSFVPYATPESGGIALNVKF